MARALIWPTAKVAENQKAGIVHSVLSLLFRKNQWAKLEVYHSIRIGIRDFETN